MVKDKSSIIKFHARFRNLIAAIKVGELHGKRTPALGGRAQRGGVAEHPGKRDHRFDDLDAHLGFDGPDFSTA